MLFSKYLEKSAKRVVDYYFWKSLILDLFGVILIILLVFVLLKSYGVFKLFIDSWIY